MNNKILVTDTLFIHDEHIKKIEAAGYEIERMDKPNATEEELISALHGKVAYVLGGIEKVTSKVLESTDKLTVIAFTGTDWKALITGWETANKKGIAISNAPGGNSFAVAEFSVSMALAMQRNLFEIGRTGQLAYTTTRSLKDITVGVVGVGKIGQKIIAEVSAFGPSRVVYYSRTQKECGAEFVEFDELLRTSDIIFVAVPGSSGQLFNEQAISEIKAESLLVTISPSNVIDFDALLTRLEQGTIRAAIDWPAPNERFEKLSLNTWFNTNSHIAYNTSQAAKLCSDMAVESLLNLLSGNEDQYLVNPEFKTARPRV